jgi:hypothetical protein
VIDCATLSRPAERVAFEQATHVIRVMPATAGGVRRAASTLRAIRSPGPGRETIIARHEPGAQRARLPELDALAADRRAELVFMAHVGDLAERRLDDAIAAADLTLRALGGALGR